MKDPLLSVVIANYNYGRFLETAIRSVLDQQCPEVELIVVDGGSKDDSVNIIRKYADRLAWWVSEPDGGQSNAFNKGFSHAKGKYLTWVNADDIMIAGCLKKVVRAMTRHPDCQWFTGNMFRFTQDGNVTGIAWGPHFYPQWVQCGNSPLVTFGPSTFFSKKIYEEVGKIDESLHYVMDTDLWVRFMKMGVKMRRINCFCWGFRMHESSKTAEFGEHLLNKAAAEKLRSEESETFVRSGYQCSLILRFMVQILRLIDGSFVRLWWFKRTFKNLGDYGVL